MKISKKKKQILEQYYLDVSKVGSLSGSDNFFHALKIHKIKVSKDQVKKWLATPRTYTIHKPIRKKFTRNKVTSFKIDYIWQIDLIDMIKLGKFNEGIKYLLTCIDVFSKYAWVVPLKDKSASETVRAFKEILKTGRKPKHVQSDKGKEFLNKQIKSF